MISRTFCRLGSLALAAALCLGLVACSGEAEAEEHEGTATGAKCPGTDGPTAENFGTAFLQTYCLKCHSESVTGDARQGAPTDTNFDTLEEVRFHSMHMDEHAASGPNATNTEMPPAKQLQPTLEERQKLGQWLACGAL